jgi:hypothetical protein
MEPPSKNRAAGTPQRLPVPGTVVFACLFQSFRSIILVQGAFRSNIRGWRLWQEDWAAPHDPFGDVARARESGGAPRGPHLRVHGSLAGAPPGCSPGWPRVRIWGVTRVATPSRAKTAGFLSPTAVSAGFNTF